MKRNHGFGVASCKCVHGDDTVHDLNGACGVVRLVNSYIDHGTSAVCEDADSNSDSVTLTQRLFRPFSERLSEDSTFGGTRRGGVPSLAVSVSFARPIDVVSIAVISSDIPMHIDSFDAYAGIPIGSENLEDWGSASNTNVLVSPGEFCGVVRYPLKAAHFTNVSTIGLVFKQSTALSRVLSLQWVGIYGRLRAQKVGAVATSYEAIPNVGDHPKMEESLSMSLIS